jgi:2Fe-2S ferredoxin
MITVNFVKIDGEKIAVKVDEGTTVMEAAVENDIEEIVGDCEGECACATCHCFIDAAWESKTGRVNDEEDMLLDICGFRQNNSRLGCQIKLTPDLDGIVVHLPESQF